MIRNLLSEIWLSKPETARRVRQRVGAVLNWDYSSGYRDSEAPMQAITKGLPRQPKQDGHFAAMTYSTVPAFIPKLPERESFSRLDRKRIVAGKSVSVRVDLGGRRHINNKIMKNQTTRSHTKKNDV